MFTNREDQLKAELKEQLLKQRKKAIRNYYRQRTREELDLPTRVSSSFWLQCRNDINRQLRQYE